MIGNRDNPRNNSEGYSDPTAYLGTREIVREESEVEKLNHKVIQTIRFVTDLAGFEIIGRITLKHRKTGKVFR